MIWTGPNERATPRELLSGIMSVRIARQSVHTESVTAERGSDVFNMKCYP
jgi:hypothetical protein